jgi:hypothetical protein
MQMPESPETTRHTPIFIGEDIVRSAWRHAGMRKWNNLIRAVKKIDKSQSQHDQRNSLSGK